MEKSISICVAIYNINEKFLRECLESLVADKSDDVEIILGDDCSTNGCDKICLEYASADSRIKYIRPPKNGGVSVVRNMMIESAEGKNITFVDGDDVISKDYVKNLRKLAKFDFDIVMFEMKSFYGEVPQELSERSSIIAIPADASHYFSVACMTGEPPFAERYGIENSTPSSVCIKAYRRKFLIDNNLKFKEGLRKSQDTVFNTGAFYCCKSLGYIPSTLYFYRTNPESVCNRYSKDFDKMMMACFECDLENLTKLYKNDPQIRKSLYKYKTIKLIIDNFKLNIFHKDNPKSRSERKKDFLKFTESEMCKKFFGEFDFEKYNWNERKIILKLAKRKMFALLDVVYKHPIMLKACGWLKGKTDRLKRR